MADVSANWARGHPWAAVYDFFVEREALSRPAGLLLFGTDTRLLHGRGPVSVLRHASCPVLIVRSKEEADLP